MELSDITEEAEAAELRFPSSRYDLETWVTVLTEEVGKLARVANKLRIAESNDVREMYRRYGAERLVTIAATVYRLSNT